MKVLFVSSGNAKEGISPIIRNQADSLKKNGIEIEHFPIQGKGIAGYLKNIKPLKDYLKCKNFQIIHAHYGLCGIIAQLIRTKEKLIVSFMGDDLIGSINQKGNYSFMGNFLTSLNKLFISSYDYVIVKSQQMAEGLKTAKLQIIPNGVDLKLFVPIDKFDAKQKINFDPEKKIIIFVTNPERPEKNYILAKKSISALNRKDIVLLPVYNIAQDELKYYYSAADLLLMTSLHEGSPNVIKEAMACNCPIVSTDVGDVSDIIGNTEGCFISSYNPEEIAHLINLALVFSDKNGRTDGRQRIIDLQLDSDTVAQKIISIYQSLK